MKWSTMTSPTTKTPDFLKLPIISNAFFLEIPIDPFHPAQAPPEKEKAPDALSFPHKVAGCYYQAANLSNIFMTRPMKTTLFASVLQPFFRLTITKRFVREDRESGSPNLFSSIAQSEDDKGHNGRSSEFQRCGRVEHIASHVHAVAVSASRHFFLF
jgi:hypothetical protein